MRDPRTENQQLNDADLSSRSGGQTERARRRRQLERHYWDFFINSPPSDPLNQLSDSIRAAPEGSINSVRSDVHTPEIMSEHVKEIGAKLGAGLVGIVALDPSRDRPPDVPQQANFAVVCVMPATYDPDTSPGIGGQVPVQDGLMVSFILSAFFRESGYFASMLSASTRDRANLAVRAGLGSIDRQGRLKTRRHGTRIWVADIVYTDFPLAARS